MPLRLPKWKLRSGILKGFLLVIALVALIGTMALGAWMFRLDRGIKKRLAEKRFAPPVEFYSAPATIQAGATYPVGHFESLMAKKNFRRRDFGQPIQPADFSVWTADQCRSVVALAPEYGPEMEPAEDGEATIPPATTDKVTRCIAFRNSEEFARQAAGNDEVHILALTASGKVTEVFTGAQPVKVEFARLEPELFAQYYGDRPVLRDVVTLGRAPTMCLNALLAIEDSQFLEHPGISFTGLLRAVITNIRSGRKAQGGSTITQQLVKNYFLTDEKTLKRKLTEIAMAFLVERHASKDDILETYINLIYMGQNGPYEVRGFAAASEHYFGKPLSDLALDQCALLAAVLNSPGLYNPFRHPERAMKRRALVLDRMAELRMIDPEEAESAKATPLPTKSERFLTEPAPYFVQAVRRELAKAGFDESEGLKVYTTLNLRAQEAAHQSVRAGLSQLESGHKAIKKLKESGKSLEAVLISANPRTGAVEALVGGRGFLATQFNRAIDSRRQVGSVMKPFVYLTALESLTPEGEPYTPLSLLPDVATTHKFEGQTWTPRNYDGKYRGEVPLFWALKESLNAATVNLGLSVGLENIIDVSRRMGLTSSIKPLPSLTLGAFELSPFEVLQSFSTIARLGERVPLTLIERVEDLEGTELFQFEPEPELVVASETAATLVGAMKQTLLTGTGRGARWRGFTHPAAGKTGTTNDKKDAWFAGFTPYHAAIVWVGYDDNTSHGLTGSSGAVPIWANYMKSYASHYPADDFPWPEGSTEKVTLSPEQQMSFGVPTKGNETLEPVELIFKRGQAPQGLSPVGMDPLAPRPRREY